MHAPTRRVHALANRIQGLDRRPTVRPADVAHADSSISQTQQLYHNGLFMASRTQLAPIFVQ